MSWCNLMWIAFTCSVTDIHDLIKFVDQDYNWKTRPLKCQVTQLHQDLAIHSQWIRLSRFHILINATGCWGCECYRKDTLSWKLLCTNATIFCLGQEELILRKLQRKDFEVMFQLWHCLQPKWSLLRLLQRLRVVTRSLFICKTS